MRITSKGQVTIPLDIRERAGLAPHMEVEFVIERGKIVLRQAEGRDRPRRSRRRPPAPRAAQTTLSTDETLALTRGE